MNYNALTTTTRLTDLREASIGGRVPAAQSHVALAYLGQWGEPATRERVRRRIHWIASQVRGPRVLDIGTSGGLVPILLGREGFHVVGVGLDVAATDWANELLEQEPQVVRDRVQFRDASLLQEGRDLQFDTLILTDVLEQVSNVGHFVDTAVQHLPPGGRLIATAPFGLHPAPHHKHSFFISDIQRLFSCHGRIEQLSVVEGYIRLVLARDEAATASEKLPASSLADTLALTEEATLASQSLLWRQLDAAAQQVEKLRDEVAGAEQRASQGEEEKLEKQAALEVVTRDFSLLQERLRAADTRLQERQQQLEELRRTLDARAAEAGDARVQAAELRARHDLLRQELRQREADLLRAREQQEAAQEKLAERQARITILEQNLAQAVGRFSSPAGMGETALPWLTETAPAGAEVAVEQQQLKDAEQLLAELAAQLEEQKASTAEWVDAYVHLEEEKEKAEQRAADAEGKLGRSEQELLQARQALVEAEARHEAALARLDERQLLVEEQAEELKELRGRIDDYEKRLELNAVALQQARQKEQKASQELSVRDARIAELQQQLLQESAQLSARSHELEKIQAARTALTAEAAGLRRRLDAAHHEKHAAEQELAALKAVAATQLTVLDGERLLWVEPLLELFRRVEVQVQRTVEARPRSFLGSKSRIKEPASAKLAPRKLANLSTEIAKERYREDPFALLLLASLADALDPQPARRKWLGFRMVKAGLLDAAEQALTPLQGIIPFSPSEEKAWQELLRRPKLQEGVEAEKPDRSTRGDRSEADSTPAVDDSGQDCIDPEVDSIGQPPAACAPKCHGVAAFDDSSSRSAPALQRSLKLPEPRQSGDLLFSAHTESMLRALKGEESEPAQKPAVDESPGEQVKLRDVSQVDYAAASQWFYGQGLITDTLRVLESLQSRGVKFDKPKRDFQAFVAGIARLKGGWPLPPRQPNPGLMTRRQHVLYCLHQSVPHATNGYSTRSHGVAVGLQQAGFKVRATTRPGFPWDAGAKGLNKGYHEAEVEGVTYAACAGWNLNKTPLDYYLAEAADHYLREAQTSGAEIIIAASNHITALPALMAARRLGLPFVYEVRGLWELTQASTQPEWAGSERYQLMRELEQQAALEADLVITLTEELADELASWGVPRERIQVVPNAVNAERFQPMAADAAIANALKLKPGVPVIGYAGSAVAYEGLELLMEAMAKLKQSGQAFTFVLVGDGKVIDTVKAKAKTLGIEGECRFTGRVPFEEVPRYLSCMDILPIPRLSSAVTEMVSALKPLEAMAMGKALVLSDVSPHTTMAGPNGERARLFTKDSAEALSEALQALIDSPEERARLGQAARAWIEQERTWNHVTRRYADALQQVRRETSARATKAVLIGAQHDAKPLEQITLGLIADQFTTDTLASAVKVVPLSPENWREELAKQPIDAIFVEAAWKGNGWQWHRKVGYYSDEEFVPFSELLTHCREQGIPSLFWNKEDPVHFDRFRKAAALCDHVFTTDSRRIIPYLATPGALSQSASSAPFYASPKLHNLLPSNREWQATAAYGGTYYGKRYPERTEFLDKIMSAAAPLGLTIYDRQHDDPESPYKYPGGLGAYVAGGLSYEAMIQAYKAHPVQINVNSVLDSPTMFSRRVVESAACGSPMISGPALGMNRYLEGAGHVVRTESEAAQALENLLHHPAYRWRVTLKAARAVMRAHTTELRLTQMLRTAGMVISAPQPPAIQLVAERITEAASQRLLAQTLRPARVLASHWQPGTQARLEAAGIACGSPEGQSVEAESLWLLADANALADLEPEDLEDLAWPTRYAPQARIGFNRSPELAEGEWPGVALANHPTDAGLQLVRAEQRQPLNDLRDWAVKQPALALRKPPQIHEQAPSVPPKKTVVIAGHDLKFIKPFYPYFTKAGIRLLLDFWTGHNQHNETASKRLVRQADTVFCEWTLGNAIWYAKHKREGQKLVGRLHLQEIDHALFPKIPFETFDTVMFVGPHILRQGIAKNPVLKKNGIVVYNGVDVEGLQSVPRKATNGKVLGIVGIVPQRKRFDLALDILRELRKEDDDYILRIKGKRPEEYSWMAHRPEEMAWYEEQYRRLEEDPLLKGAVIFDPHGNDMPEWYAGIDFALSTSDFESFHFTIADSSASGCMPIILPWEGADEIYPKEWVYPDVKTAAEGIKADPKDRASVRRFARSKFDINAVAFELNRYLL